ncbi:mitochondrial large subunit ribosomal protein L49 [Pseudohyphozyma bogoriensis]|nr:mitochondrial large subunit ribosomal protein L49 [Pseudohyphozyma bogoriensis]
MSRILASSSRLRTATKPPCSCPRLVHTTTTSLPPPMPLQTHPNSLNPTPFPAPESTALELLKSQPSHYVSALLMGRRYLLSPNDILTVPHVKNVKPGDTLALTRILEVGSRDYTLRAQPASPSASSSSSAASLAANKADLLIPAAARSVVANGVPRDWQRHPDSLPYLGEDVVRAKLTVLEHTKGKMFEVEKFKRRKGYRRLLKSKLEWTRFRVGDIEIGPRE